MDSSAGESQLVVDVLRPGVRAKAPNNPIWSEKVLFLLTEQSLATNHPAIRPFRQTGTKSMSYNMILV